MILTRRPLLSAKANFESAACLLCQWRSFSSSYRHLAEKPSTSKGPPSPSVPPTLGAAAPTPPTPPPSPLEGAPRAYGQNVDEFTPKPLNRPIGLPNPPLAGENSGKDTRTLQQRRDDFVDYDKHLERRKELTHKVAKPYFREWSNMRFSKGKSFLAPPGLFRAERALFFPNLQGQTLLKDKKIRDTTPVFQDKVSIVSTFNTQWAENQVNTFVSEKENPELQEVVKGSGGVAQMVQINHEPNWMKAMIVKFFMYNLRKQRAPEDWGRYFLVRKGFTEEMREEIGLLNSKVGYTYLLDGNCRIRWAGSGKAEGEEKEGLVKSVRRLVEEANTKRKERPMLPRKQAIEAKSVHNQKDVASTA
ncbi:Mitochondrial ATPase complex subunit [Lachnellula hyalina]|uniref:Mitochondrial ATPase complex subunit n=1 Tax=Lachnellula hyalina TaxID=1316788 RepID=A0A8H8TTT9_9HELO|nr:Mitochondrial ATPase complex subunit [Lachnellula hyalina]TVY22134.1 Mitochondrial ATPase complex subunit [Lachnellula hyalina]